MTCSTSRSPAPLFALGPGALGRLSADFALQIREGLARGGARVAGLPAWLPRPAPDIEGAAVVVDLGGTHARAALVALCAEGGLHLLAGPVTAPVPGVGDPSVSREAFFDAQAALVAALDPPAGLPLGYCFSFPAAVEPDGDARLLRWTKDIRIAGVEGERVGALLVAALRRRGLVPGPVWVLNDTVAALLAGARRATRDHAHVIGLVVGTGTNMASFFPRASLPKLAGEGPDMAVNLESGNLDPCETTLWDMEIDEASDNPGRQGFEKAVSGRYLPRLLAQVLGDPSRCDPSEGAGALVRLRVGEGEVAETAGAILDRSADLVACGLAALLEVLGPGRALVAAEGGLFWKAGGYPERVGATLAALLGDAGRVHIARIDDANLEGAAVAALAAGGAV
ncbi:MAG: hypothetical protein ABIO70_27625 [Pseudomonadota bacterium]